MERTPNGIKAESGPDAKVNWKGRDGKMHFGKLSSRSASSTPRAIKSPTSSRSTSPDIKAEAMDNSSYNTPDTELASKASTTKSKSSSSRSPQLFDHLPDATDDALSHFQAIPDCLYGSKSMGASENDILDCDCAEEWSNGENQACGEDSDCINRATKMECVENDCNCGATCQNQRFQRRQYANVSVIKTEKKGFGLRANVALQANDFIFEYIGDVINEPTFRRRMIQYDREGIKHFYFMSLTRTEFVDATKRGNLGRFCNHSCSPNSYVDKWVVGDKLRMGIFAERNIRAGEEIVFNYNVDRYGADPQPCYCGEPNCTGFIGGKTQTERATKLSAATIEALGIEEDDDWDTTVAKKPKKKKVSEDDEDYVNSVQARGLDEKGVTKVMAALMQCKEKWIAVKLLQRMQDCHDDRVKNQIVRMHGYQILKTALNTFKDDDNVVLQILDVLHKFPRLTKNKITDAKIEAVVQALATSDNDDVADSARRLNDEWSKLATGYRIPRRKFDPAAASAFEERRKQEAVATAKKAEKPASPTRDAPKGPRNPGVAQQRPAGFSGFRPPPPRRVFGPLPSGWYTARDPSGNDYFYTKGGATTWQRPTQPVVEGPTIKEQRERTLQDIIDNLSKEAEKPKESAASSQQDVQVTPKASKEAKWRSLPLEKQQKIYENTLFPHVKHVMDKFRHKLPKDELKKFAKEVNKKLVASDYKNNRVDDPTTISAKQERKIKIYVKEFLDRAVQKYQAHQKKKETRKKDDHRSRDSTTNSIEMSQAATPVQDNDTPTQDDSIMLSDIDDDLDGSPLKKRKRDEDEEEASPSMTPEETPSVKRLKEEEAIVTGAGPSPPPPPPPPPAEPTNSDSSMRGGGEAPDIKGASHADDDHTHAPAEAEAASIDPDVQRRAAEDEAEKIRQEEALQRENEEAMRDFELEQSHHHHHHHQQHQHQQSNLGSSDLANGVMIDSMDVDLAEHGSGQMSSSTSAAVRKQEVLGH